jgi:hypothetical protein
MTKRIVPRKRSPHSPDSLFDLRLLVLLALAGLLVWLAVVRPAVAAPIGLGLSALYVLHRIVGR